MNFLVRLRFGSICFFKRIYQELKAAKLAAKKYYFVSIRSNYQIRRVVGKQLFVFVQHNNFM